MGRLSVPSKVYSYMASGRAILASVPANSEVKTLVDDSGCGVWVPPDTPEVMAELIVEMSRSPAILDVMGQRGREYAMQHCSRSAATSAYHRLLHETVASSSSGQAGSGRLQIVERR